MNVLGILFILLFSPSGNSQLLLPIGYPCEIFRHFPKNVTWELQPVNVGSCRPKKDCTFEQTSRYRTYDGSCNNLHPEKSLCGSKNSEFVRLARRTHLFHEGYPPKFYFVSKNRYLPNARDVSSKVHSGKDVFSKIFTTMLMQVGQLIDHDLTLTPEINLCSPRECPSKQTIDCCDFIDYDTYKARNVPEGCMPILIPEDDEFYSQQHPRVRCLDFKVSKVSPSCNMKTDYTSTASLMEPFNAATGFLDASMTYGSNKEAMKKLRSFVDGRLKANEVLGPHYLPFEETDCPHIDPELFQGGDERVNENPGLQSHHTLWLREHNRIAAELKRLRPDWDDETLFQEARRIVIAEWQNMVYSEFLPIVLGPEYVEYDDALNVKKDSVYDPEICSDILLAFSTAAFRFGHSLINSNVHMYENGKVSESFPLQDSFFNTSAIRKDKLDLIIEGMCYQKSNTMGPSITRDVRNFLFKKTGQNHGSDLAARNIQRGRNHELAPYNTYRKLCGLSPLPKNFDDPPPEEFSQEIWTLMSQLYHEPEDIELFPGGMSEKMAKGAIVGPTFQCIIGEQFRRLRLGDRYFFTHKNVPDSVGYCKEERANIRSRKLSHILCDNTNIQHNFEAAVFLVNKTESLNLCESKNKFSVDIKCPTKDYKTELSTSNMVALLVGGYNGTHTLNSVELYSPKGTCQHRLPDFPVRVYNINLQYLGLGRILACGGRSLSFGGRKDCWKLDSNNFKWEHLPHLSLNYPRWLSASAMHRGNWILSGGHYSPKTSEILLISSRQTSKWKWVPGPDFPDDGKKQHCMVIIDDDLFIFGGFGSGMSVTKYNFESRTWTTLNHTLIYYRYKHQCVILSTYRDVLLMGGPSGTVYDIETGDLYLTPRPQFPRNFGSVITLGQRTFALGGDYYSTTVEEYHFYSNRFSIVPFNLFEKRSRFGVVAVPDYFFNNLPGGCKG